VSESATVEAACYVDQLEDQENDLAETVVAIAERVRADGEVTASDVRELRQAIDGLQHVVENRLAEKVGLEPHASARQSLTYGQMCDTLGISIEDVNELWRRRE